MKSETDPSVSIGIIAIKDGVINTDDVELQEEIIIILLNQYLRGYEDGQLACSEEDAR